MYLQVFEKFYTPPQEIQNKLKKIVKNLLSKHGGGKEFFNASDD